VVKISLLEDEKQLQALGVLPAAQVLHGWAAEAKNRDVENFFEKQ